MSVSTSAPSEVKVCIIGAGCSGSIETDQAGHTAQYYDAPRRTIQIEAGEARAAVSTGGRA